MSRLGHIRRIDCSIMEQTGIRGSGERIVKTIAGFGKLAPDTRAKSILPKYAARGLLDIKNTGNECLRYAILAQLAKDDLIGSLSPNQYNVKKYQASTYDAYSGLLKTQAVSWPAGVSFFNVQLIS